MIVSRNGASVLEPDLLERLLELNPDGVGIAFPAEGAVAVWRALAPPARRVATVLACVPAHGPCVVHFRKGTCGPVDREHVQPLRVNSQGTCVFAHNGTLLGWGSAERSDSVRVARAELAPLCDAPGSMASMRARLDVLWHPGNRFVLLDAEGGLEVVGESEGVWRGQTWFSNPKQLG